ncbi:hypothetical protein [Streptomyces sp. RG80]|uniref:hypothetical protein n=1 Tax=Streptomyces sp. RG80 TaxID=3157340 RepID=UPI00338DBE12
MITRPDDDPDLDPDDPLTVLLRPPADYLGPPHGRYEAIRRGAIRRKLLRTAAGAAVACGVAAAVLLPLRLSTSEAPVTPTVPLAPPPASSPSSVPPATATPAPISPVPDTPSASSVPTATPTTTGAAEPTPTERP